MRTTLTVDDDLLQAIKQQAAEKGLTFKEVLNQTLRRGLTLEPAKKRKPFKIKPHSLGLRPEYASKSMNHLAAELEDEAILNKMHCDHAAARR